MENLSSLHILVIDDDEDDFQVTREMLETNNTFSPHVGWARNYEDGLAALKSGSWNVCLLDNRLGPNTGLGLLIEARSAGVALPVIVLTSQDDHHLDESFLEAGASDFLLKADLTPVLLGRSIRYSVNQSALSRRLEQSNAELKRFAYVASHDLKEPLRTIAGFSQLLLRRYHEKLDPEANEMVEFVAGAAKRLNTMISDLLNYSRLDAPTAPALIDCGELLTITLATLAAAVRESGAEIIRGPMPAIIAQPPKMEQIFLNLLSNAIKFNGGRRPRIRIQAEEQSDFWLFSVEDNGIGIAPKDQESIMEVFTRLAADYPGTGIGLAIAKKAVEQHGGRLWVKSAPGEGSTFYFTIAKGGEQ